MNKKYLVILAIFVLCSPICAQEWDDFADIDKAWDGQKSITNKEFEEVMDALNQKQNKSDEKKKKKLIKKIGGGGTSLHSDLDPLKNIVGVPKLEDECDGILINVPVNLLLDEKVLEKGYYNVVAERDKNEKIYISFYQSQFFKGKLPVIETEDDFDEKNLDFAKILPYSESFVKIIFGSIDFNAYALVPYVTE